MQPKKASLRWCFSPTKYKAIGLLVTTTTRVKRVKTKKAETQVNRITRINSNNPWFGPE
jgi:hypothetical protein